MKVGLRLYDCSDKQLKYARQIGVESALVPLSAVSGYREQGYPDRESLMALKERFSSHGLEIAGMELPHSHLQHVLLGRPERDRELDHVCRTIRCLAGAGIPALVFDLIVSLLPSGGAMPGYWANPEGRGGAVLRGFDYARAEATMDAPAGEVSEDEVWARVAAFYEAVVPVAEEVRVKLACHPDDPPMPGYRGVSQVLNSVEGLKRLMELVPSPYNGLLFCVGTLQESGADVLEAIRYFGGQGKIFVVHFRNVRGTIPKYDEVFLDNGDLDMWQAMRTLKEVGYEGTLVPDHTPGIVEDTRWGHIGRAWAVGYIKALIAAAC